MYIYPPQINTYNMTKKCVDQVKSRVYKKWRTLEYSGWTLTTLSLCVTRYIRAKKDVHIKCCRVKGCKRNGVGTWGKTAGPLSRPKCADPRLAWCWSVLAWRLRSNTLAASWRQRNLIPLHFFAHLGEICSYIGFEMCIQCFINTLTCLVWRPCLQNIHVWLQHFSAHMGKEGLGPTLKSTVSVVCPPTRFYNRGDNKYVSSKTVQMQTLGDDNVIQCL